MLKPFIVIHEHSGYTDVDIVMAEEMPDGLDLTYELFREDEFLTVDHLPDFLIKALDLDALQKKIPANLVITLPSREERAAYLENLFETVGRDAAERLQAWHVLREA